MVDKLSRAKIKSRRYQSDGRQYIAASTVTMIFFLIKTVLESKHILRAKVGIASRKT